MIRAAALFLSVAWPAHADIAPEMTKLDCALSYDAAVGWMGVPTTYEVAPVADADGWCVVDGLMVDDTPATTMRLERLRWRMVDYARMDVGLPPSALMIRANNITTIFHKGDLAALEDPANTHSTFSSEIAIDAAWDGATNKVHLHQAVIDIDDSFRAEMSGRASNVNLHDESAMVMSIGQARVHEFSYRMRAEKLVPTMMHTVGVGSDGSVQVIVIEPLSPEERARQTAEAVAAIPSRVADADTKAALIAIDAAMPDLNGRMEISAHSPDGIGVASLMAMMMRDAPPSPAEIWSLLPDLTITATYQPEDLQ